MVGGQVSGVSETRARVRVASVGRCPSQSLRGKSVAGRVRSTGRGNVSSRTRATSCIASTLQPQLSSSTTRLQSRHHLSQGPLSTAFEVSTTTTTSTTTSTRSLRTVRPSPPARPQPHRGTQMNSTRAASSPLMKTTPSMRPAPVPGRTRRRACLCLPARAPAMSFTPRPISTTATLYLNTPTHLLSPTHTVSIPTTNPS